MKIAVIGMLFLMVLTGSTALAQKKPSGAKRASTTTKPKATAKTGTVEMEAGLVFNNGDIKPVGRATFYLFKENAEKIILTQEHLDIYNKDVKSLGRVESISEWSIYGAILYMDGSLRPNFAIAARKALETAAVAQTTTGFDGKATFATVPAGDYYLFGYYKIGKQTTYWNVPVSVKPGLNKVILDNENMR